MFGQNFKLIGQEITSVDIWNIIFENATTSLYDIYESHTSDLSHHIN